MLCFYHQTDLVYMYGKMLLMSIMPLYHLKNKFFTNQWAPKTNIVRSFIMRNATKGRLSYL